MRKKLLVLCSSLFFIFLGIVKISAQNTFNEQGLPIVKIDLDKGTISREFPFDEYIKIQVTSKENKLLEEVPIFEVVYVRKTKVVNNKQLKQFIRKAERGKKVEPEEFSVSPITINIKADERDSLYEGIISPLLPDKSYNLIFSKRLSYKQLNVFYKVLNLIAKGKIEDASKLFEEKIKPLDIQSKPQMSVSTMSTFDYLKDSLAQQLIPMINAGTKNFKNSPSKVSKTDIEKYTGMLTAKKISSSEFSQTMFGYTEIGGIDNHEVLYGLRRIGSDSLVDILEIEKRKRNITKSYNLIQKLDKNFVDLISHHATDEELSEFYTKVILELKTSIKNNDSVLSALSKKVTKLVNQYYSYSAPLTNNTVSKQESNGDLAYLVPDVGFINAWGKDKIGDIEYIGRPYLGLNWHVTGYNKNKKLNQLPQKRFWSRFSMSVGITLGNIDEGGYEDLFNSLSVSTGLNIRAAKNVRLGIGSLLLRYNRNPIVDKEGLAFLPYISISFDNKFFGDFAIFNKIFN